MTEDKTGGNQGTENPVSVEQFDLGNGNIFTKADAQNLKTNNERLLGELKEAQGQVPQLQEQLTTVQGKLNSTNQEKIQSGAALEAANAKIKELQGITQNYISPEKYGELQSQVGGMEWENLVNTVKRMAAQYGVPEDKFHGKSLAQLAGMEEGMKLSNQGKKPVLTEGGALKNADGSTNGSTNWQGNIESNIQLIKELREGKKTQQG